MNVVTIPIANNSHGGGRVVPNTSIATLSTKHLCANTFAKLQLGDHPWSSSRFSTVTTTKSSPIKTISCLPTAPATTKTPTAMIATPILPVLRSVISEEDEHHEGGNRLDQQCLSSATLRSPLSFAQDSKKRKKTVRFSSTITEATMESSSNEVEDADTCRKKRRRNPLETETSATVSSPSSLSSSAAPTTASASTTPPPPPLLWYTPTELRSIQRSLIRAVRSYDRHSNTSIVTNTDQDEEDAHVLEYYSTRKRYERRNKRHRMLKTCRAVQEFAATIHTPVPLTELLSQLLHRYSSSSS